MTTRADLLRAVLAEPDSDDLRLVYADLCEDEGDDARAEFVRVQMALAGLERRLGPQTRAGDNAGQAIVRVSPPEEFTLFGRQLDLLRLHGDRWLPPAVVTGWPARAASGNGTVLRLPGRTAREYVRFRRGFLEAAGLPADDFLECADALCDSTPLREVTLTTWPEIAGDEGPPPWMLYLREQRPPVGALRRGVLRDGPFLLSAAVAELLGVNWPRLRFALPGGNVQFDRERGAWLCAGCARPLPDNMRSLCPSCFAANNRGRLPPR